MIEAFDKRFGFEQNDVEILLEIEDTLISSANHECDIDNQVRQLKDISNIISLKSLAEELEELPLIVKLYNAEQFLYRAVKRVTKVSTSCDMFTSTVATSLPQIFKLLIFYFIIPISSATAPSLATAERSFSVMRRLIKVFVTFYHVCKQS